jgi:hypothetical protein
MLKTIIKRPKRDVERAARIKKTAYLTGFSERYVRMVMDGDRESENVLNVFMAISEGENELLNQVKKLIP